MATKVLRIVALTITTLESNPPQYVIAAKGQVSKGGWTNPRLEPAGSVSEGIQTYDFVADPPKQGAIVTQAFATLETPKLNLGRASNSLLGVRVNSATNNFLKMFGDGATESMTVDGGVDVWPQSVNQFEVEGVEILPWSVTQFPQSVPMSLRDLVGRIVRLQRPNDPVTQEVRPGRITIHVDENGRATEVVVETASNI